MDLKRRTGPVPETTKPKRGAPPTPHSQISQNAPRGVYEMVLVHGWGEPHPISGTMMVFGPRDAEELEIVLGIVRASYDYARGELG